MNPVIKKVILYSTAILVILWLGFLRVNKPSPEPQVVPSITPLSSSTPPLTLVKKVTSLSSKITETFSEPTPGTSAHLLKGMHLTFSDEFNSLERYVDKKGNTTCEPGGVGRWQTVYHFCSRTNPGNSEAEVYIDQTFLDYLNNKSNASTTARNPFTTKNGILTIEAAPSDNVILSAVGQWAKYTSGMITTQFSFSQTYGYFEMRAKLPAGRGLWPAFWLLPDDETWPPEVDGMEAFGGTNPDGKGDRTMIHYASHTVPTQKDKSCSEWYDLGVDLTQDFHTYGVDVEPDGITYYFDGKSYARCQANPDTNKPFYMLINLAVGGPGSWPGVPDTSTKFPAYMHVDYARAYQKN